MQQMHRKNEKVGRKSSLSTATALQSQNGAVQSPLYSLSGPLPFSPSILPTSLQSCPLPSSILETRNQATHLSSFCQPWSPSSKSRNLYLGGRGGTSLSKSTILP